MGRGTEEDFGEWTEVNIDRKVSVPWYPGPARYTVHDLYVSFVVPP